MKSVKEDLIHYIWKTKSFDQNDLLTTDHQKLNIISFGHHNNDSGPDFLDARIELDGIVWAGHIEIHLKASDWLKHRHDNDPKYQNVILHVVLEADTMITLKDKSTIPCLELTPRIDHKLVARYQYLNNNSAWIPCETMIHEIDSITRQGALDRSLTERLTLKAEELKIQLSGLNNDWSELIYQRLSWAFGLKVNAEAMLTLSKSLPLKVIQKHRDFLIQVEALLYGQSGLVTEDIQDAYVIALKKEYRVLQAKFKLRPINPILWKFSRLRPAGFPTIRIAQLAQLLHKGSRLDEHIFDGDIDSLEKLFQINISEYWEDHYQFGVVSEKQKKSLGTGTKSIIIINAIVPILFMYGVIRQSDEHKERAINLLERIPAEQNSIMRGWERLGMSYKTAADSQALLQLKKYNCDLHKCMSCPIGHKIVTT